MKLLLAKGADVNVKGKYGHTALMTASLYGRADVEKLLKVWTPEKAAAAKAAVEKAGLTAAAEKAAAESREGNNNIKKLTVDPPTLLYAAPTDPPAKEPTTDPPAKKPTADPPIKKAAIGGGVAAVFILGGIAAYYMCKPKKPEGATATKPPVKQHEI